MKKRIFLLLLVLVISTGLVACGQASVTIDATPTTSAAENITEATQDITDNTTEENTPSPTEPNTTEAETEKVVAATYLLKNHYNMNYDFSEGYAWCNYYEGNTPRIGIIDHDGVLVFQSPDDWTNCGGIYSNTTFQNGVACVYMQSGAPIMKSFIVNVHGEILFDSASLGDNVTLEYVTCGDGTYLFKADKSDFYKTASYLMLIDSNGSILNEVEIPPYSRIDSNSTFKHMFYLGEGIFVSEHFGYVYNSRTGNFIDCNKEHQSVVSCKQILNGTCLITDKGVAPISVFDSQESYDTYIANTSDQNTRAPLGSTEYYVDNTWNIFYYINDCKYYAFDNDGTCYLEPEHRGSLIPYSGNYTVSMMLGADDNYYISVLDRNGSLVYDPVQTYPFNIWHMSQRNDTCLEGYAYAELPDQSPAIITPDGRTLVIRTDDLSEIPTNGWIGREGSAVISNGMVNLHSLYHDYTLRDPMKLPPICYIRCSDGQIIKEAILYQ